MTDINIYIIESFKDIASELDRTTASSEAVLSYDLLADALVWSDEFPPPRKDRLGDITSIRVLLRYRTSILLGKPDTSLKLYWDWALKMFPNWAALCPERLKPTEEIVKFYEEHKIMGDKSIHRMEKYCRRVNALKSKKEY
jgi:hypothetical protein